MVAKSWFIYFFISLTYRSSQNAFNAWMNNQFINEEQKNGEMQMDKSNTTNKINFVNIKKNPL